MTIFTIKHLVTLVLCFIATIASGIFILASIAPQSAKALQTNLGTSKNQYYIIRNPGASASLTPSQIQADAQTSTSTASTIPGTTSLVLDFAEVSRHASQNDCWVVIDSGIYDVTQYLPQHPGSASAIIPYCGSDASSAYHSKGGRGRDHSVSASKILAQYLIANLGETVQAVPVQPQISTPVDSSTPIITDGGGTNPGPITPPSTLLTLTEIANHSNSNDCWIVISNYVYDVTNFLPQHPGSAAAIVTFCGGDATSGLNGTGGSPRHNHSNYAYSLLNNYLIGAVGTSVPTTGGGGTTQNPTPTPIINSGAGLPPNVLKTFPNATLIKAEDSRREFQINSGGACYQIKTDATGNVIQSEPC
jgi:cytochrome b involved in lipid metabolism